MTNIVIHLSVADVITSFIVYGIVHAAWSGVKWCLRHLETEAGHIIESHVKNGHEARFKYCFKDSCAIRPGTAPDSLRQALQPEQP